MQALLGTWQRRRAAQLVPLLLLGTTASCGGGSPSSPPAPSPTPAIAIRLSPGSLTLNVGGVGTLTAMVTDASGAPVPNAAESWQSRNALVASVSSGSVAGIAVGQTTVVASSGGKADSALVIVLDPITLTIVPSAGTVNVSQSFPFTVVARNSSGQTIPAPAVSWSSSSPAIATISTAGVATGVARGVVTISASGAGATATPASLTVTDPAAACGGIASVAACLGAEGRSLVWAAQNSDKNVFYPGGFAVALTNSTGPAGAATFNYAMTVKP